VAEKKIAGGQCSGSGGAARGEKGRGVVREVQGSGAPFIGEEGRGGGAAEAVARGRWRPAPLMAAALSAVVEGVV
jgi:hypothetical protein